MNKLIITFLLLSLLLLAGCGDYNVKCYDMRRPEDVMEFTVRADSYDEAVTKATAHCHEALYSLNLHVWKEDKEEDA